MGIEKFFSNLQSSSKIYDPTKFTTKCIENIKTVDGNVDIFMEEKNVKKLDTTHFYIDFNSIIYNIGSYVSVMLSKIICQTIFGDLSSKRIDELNQIDPYLSKYGTSVKELLTLSPENVNLKLDPIVDNIVADCIKNNVVNMVKSLTDKDRLKKVVVSFDGVPTYAKVIEQLKRRYMRKIERKFGKELMSIMDTNFSEKRKQYEKYKLQFNYSIAVPGTVFMNDLASYFTTEFIESFNDYNDLIVVCSTPQINGEAEMKIMIDIKSDSSINSDSSILFYSPDSDVIILCQLIYSYLLTKNITLKNLYMLRLNQQEKGFNNIDIIKYCDDLYDHMSRKLSNKINMKDIKYDKAMVIASTGFLFTIFGNDFIPRMVTIDIKNDFNDILENYTLALSSNYSYLEKKFGKQYGVQQLISYTGTYELNVFIFSNFLSNLVKLEAMNIERFSLMQKHNYNRLLRLFDFTNAKFDFIKKKNLISGLEKYFELLENFQKLIVDSPEDFKVLSRLIFSKLEPLFKNKDTVGLIELKNFNELILSLKTEDNEMNKIIQGGVTYLGSILKVRDNRELIKKLKDVISSVPTVENPDLKFALASMVRNGPPIMSTYEMFVMIYTWYYLKHNKFMRVDYFSKDRTFDSEYHRKNYLKEVIIPYSELTSYDEELYKFSSLLDEYSEIMNAKELNLCGYVIMPDGGYKKCNTSDEIVLYYRKNFYIKDTDNYEQAVNKIALEYLEGIIWTFRYYFNDHYDNKSSIWAYKYKLSPLLRDIYSVYKKKLFSDKLNTINNIIAGLVKKDVLLKDYMTPTEHSAYISVMNSNVEAKEKSSYTAALDIAKEGSVEIDLDKIVNDILTRSKDVNNNISCTGAIYLSKCMIHRMYDKIMPIDIYLSKLHA